MIAAKIIIETQDGCQYSYVNKYLTAKSGNDGEGHTLFAGIPEDLYYYTGAGTDTYANQTGLGKAKGDYDHIKEKADSRTGLIGFPEADSTHADTYELIRTHDFKDAISNDRGSINAADVKMVKLVEREVEYPFPYLRDNETRTNQTYNNDAGIPRTKGCSLYNLPSRAAFCIRFPDSLSRKDNISEGFTHADISSVRYPFFL